MYQKFLFIIILTVLSAVFVSAQDVHTPGKNSPERKAILDALRIPVEKELKQKIIFSVEHFNVLGNWAFLSGEPQATNSDRPDLKNTKYRTAADAGMFDYNFFALMKKTGGKWKVVTHSIGCTDVCYLTWWKDYKAPKAIFPYIE